ncbi:2702_t:CDS:1, partial [Dentiscutata erythropus]
QPTADMKNIRSAKTNEEASKLDDKLDYKNITSNMSSYYLEELDNADDDNDKDKIWHPCNDTVPEDWLGPNDHENAEKEVLMSYIKTAETDHTGRIEAEKDNHKALTYNQKLKMENINKAVKHNYKDRLNGEKEASMKNRKFVGVSYADIVEAEKEENKAHTYYQQSTKMDKPSQPRNKKNKVRNAPKRKR